MKTATLGQIQKILNALENVPSEKIQLTLERGLITDCVSADPNKVNRVEIRKVLGLPSLIETCSKKSFSLGATEGKKTTECFVTQPGIRVAHCKKWKDVECKPHYNPEESQAMRLAFEACLPSVQANTLEGKVYLCKIGKHLSILSFAQYIAGTNGSVEEISQQLIQRGYCLTLPEFEKIMKMWSAGEVYIDMSTAGLLFFVQNRDGLVSVVKTTSSPYDYDGCGLGAEFEVFPITDTYESGGMQLFHHEQIMVKEPIASKK